MLTSDYTAVCDALRERLRDVENVKHDGQELERFTRMLRTKERDALPHKKRRALHVAEHLLERQLRYEEERHGPDRALIADLLTLFKPTTDESSVDLEAFANHWHEALAPLLAQRRKERRRKREFVSILDLMTNRKQAYFTTEQLRRIREGVTFQEPLDAQVAACVVGVRMSGEQTEQRT